MYLDNNFRKYKKPNKNMGYSKRNNFWKKNTKSNIDEIIVNGNTCKDPTGIANEFNTFFSKIGKNISESVELVKTYPNL